MTLKKCKSYNLVIARELLIVSGCVYKLENLEEKKRTIKKKL